MSGAPAVFRALWGMRRRTRADRAALDRFQDASLRRLVRHAYANVPYYRALFDRAGVDPDRIRSVADLPRIPITAKADLRPLPPSDILARGRDPARLFSVRTSGSSGHPFTVYRTWLESALQYLLRIRTLGDFGVGFTDRTATVGSRRPKDPRDRKLAGRALAALGIKRRLTLDGLESPDALARQLVAWQPTLIIAMTTMLDRVAEYMLQQGVTAVRPRVVIVGGEMTTPQARRRLEQAFGAPVLETYACHEVPLLGWQCASTGQFHVCDDGAILEVVEGGRPVSPGQAGEVVVTNLHAYTMPLIRYRLADIVTRGERSCACGRPFSTIGGVQGRIVDLFSLPGGRILNPYEVISRTIFGEEGWLRQYQLLQERRDRVVLSLVPFTTPDPERLAAIERASRSVLGPAVEFELRLVNDLPLEPSGKFRPMRSLVGTAVTAASRAPSPVASHVAREHAG